MGGKKRDDDSDPHDDNSEISDNRPAGVDAEIFSQPIGYVARFPPPPKYIKVKAHNRKKRDFDRTFLAQVLLGDTKLKTRKPSDEKIVSIDDAPPPADSVPKTGANSAIWAMEFSKDGKYLAAAGQDKKLRVWAVISTAEEREAEEKQSYTEPSSENTMKLNAPVFAPKLIREYEGHTSSILDLSWSKNNFLLSSSMDKTVRLYHVSRSECLCAFKHNDFVTSIQFHPRDDRFFLAGSLDSKLRLWSIPDKSVAYWVQVPDMVTAVAFTPDGKTSIAGCLNGMCILYDTEGLQAHSQIHVRSARGRNAKGSKITGIDTIALSREHAPPSVKILITSNDSRVRMYNLKDRSLEVKFRGNENTSSQIHATFSDDGRYVICGSEDRKVYIWPTGPTEKQDPDKRPLEVFEAHTAIVTTALLAPTSTRRLLAKSGDPLYDLCNPPPVTLVSRADSVISSRAPTDNSGNSKDDDEPAPSPESRSPRRAPETPAYLARHTHRGGNIIVTADYTGTIKVFRQDCAFTKRRQDSWDGGSTFSRRIMGRSGSGTTRTSWSSSNQTRQSLNLGSKNPSADRILNWRNSVSSTGQGNPQSISELSLRDIDNNRAASRSPILSPLHRSSKGAGATSFPNQPSLPVPTTTPPPSPPAEQSVTNSPPRILVQHGKANEPLTTEPDRLSRSNAQAKKSPSLDPPKFNPVPVDPDDPLYLQGSQSFMYWNVKRTLAPMANRVGETADHLDPNLLGRVSRNNSYVSALSSDLTSTSESDDENTRDSRNRRKGERTRRRRESDASAHVGAGGGGEKTLKCARCGNDSFSATVDSKAGQAQRLRCRRCGLVA